MYAPVHKPRSIKTWFDKVGVEKHEKPAQDHDLDSTEHFWDEL